MGQLKECSVTDGSQTTKEVMQSQKSPSNSAVPKLFLVTVLPTRGITLGYPIYTVTIPMPAINQAEGAG